MNQDQQLPALTSVLNDSQSNFNDFERNIRKSIMSHSDMQDVEFQDETTSLLTLFKDPPGDTVVHQTESNVANNSLIGNDFDWDDLQPIRTMAKTRVSNLQENLSRVELEPLVEDFETNLDQINSAHSLRIAEGTRLMQIYSARAYKQFYEDKCERDSKFKLHQPNPFPIKKYTFAAFLYTQRVEKQYAHSTCVWAFLYGLCEYSKTRGYGDYMSEYGDFLKDLLKGLLRKFGNIIDKVPPVMNEMRDKICSAQDLNTAKGKLVNAVFRQGRARGLRADTWYFAKIRHLSWKKVDLPITRQFVINCVLTIIKDKVLMNNQRQQKVTGAVNLSRCANVALLIYLADERQIFEAGSSLNVLQTGNFSVKSKYLDHPVFVQQGTDIAMSSKDLGNLVKNAGLSVDVESRVTFRGLRSGCLCQAFVNDIIKNGVPRDETAGVMAEFIGWKTISSMKPYMRYAATSLTHVTSRLEPEEQESVVDVVNASVDNIPIESSRSLVGPTMDMTEEALKLLIFGNEPSTPTNSKKRQKVSNGQTLLRLIEYQPLK